MEPILGVSPDFDVKVQEALAKKDMAFHPKFRKTANQHNQDDTSRNQVKIDDKEGPSLSISENNAIFGDAGDDSERNFIGEKQDPVEGGKTIFSILDQ